MAHTINVGILAAPTVSISFHGKYRCVSLREDTESVITARAAEGMVVIGAEAAREWVFTPLTADASFEIRDVLIGIDFHWQQRQNQRFRGECILRIDHVRTDCVRVINRVDLEEYLTSVISSEMSATSPPELLKAHAIVSRSWLVAQLRRAVARPVPPAIDLSASEIVTWWDREDHTGFDVCADDHCQRYQGITHASHPGVISAIEATRGVVLRYPDAGGEVCDARFSKCCGGRSELFESCWDTEPHPYLTSVECRWCDTSDQQIISTVLNGYDQSTHHFHHWEVSYTPAELGALFERRSGIHVGEITGLEAVETGPSGRIVRLKVTGTDRTLIIGKELLIRRWLSESHLYSSAFTALVSPERITLHGRGWGHGVGMCQIGAAVMAAQGHSHTEILAHYFPRTVLSPL